MNSCQSFLRLPNGYAIYRLRHLDPDKLLYHNSFGIDYCKLWGDRKRDLDEFAISLENVLYSREPKKNNGKTKRAH